MTQAAEFREQAAGVVRAHVERLRSELSFTAAQALPAVEVQDIVVAGKEVHFTIFRQADLPILPGRVLVTVQVARYGLGGVVSFRAERGLVFSADAAVRDATQDELQNSGT